MDKNECTKLGETIYENHTLWGLHMMGNDCVLDSLGFIRTDYKNKIQTRDIL
jgi:NLR family CARD domain-containing protein 3